MAEIVNLRRARKAKARLEKDKTAAANRTAFGRTKAEKASAKAETARSARELNGKRRERDDGSS